MKAGWHTRTLGEACQIARGGSPRPIQEFLTDDPDGVNWVKISDATASGKYIYETKEKIKPSGVSRSRLVKSGDFLLSNSMSFGRPYIMQTTGCIHDGWLVLSDYEQCFAQGFLYHLLGSPVVFEQFDRLAAGSTVRNLNIDLASRVTLPIPPLPEQHRIVAILDEAFDGIATAKANAEKNLQNARALFETHLQSVFTERGEGWVEKRLGDIAEVQSGGTPTVSKKEFWNGDIPWYSSGELNRTLTTNPERHITMEGLENSNAKLFPKGALLVGMYDTAALKMSILDRDGAFNQAIAGIKPNNRIDVEFILHAINAEKPKLLLERRGVRQKNLSLGKIKEITVPLPAPEVQISVVERLREVSSETRYLESLYQQKLIALDDLKKSLLHQAFSGNL
jgi:type I restriction enzyme S subunit